MPTALADREAKRAERESEGLLFIQEQYKGPHTLNDIKRAMEVFGRERYSYHGIALDLFVEECLRQAQPHKEKKPREARPYVLYAVSVRHTEQEGYMIAFCQARDAREARKIISLDALAMGYTGYHVRFVEKMKVRQGQIKYF